MPHTLFNTHKRGPSPYLEDEGFTLIEMVLVIIILGILATIVLVAVQSLTSTSSITACKSDYKIVETAQEAFRGQTGAYATSVNDFLTTRPGLSGGTVGPWLKEAPSSTRGYQIGIAADGTITVQSTSPAHGPDPGNADCAYA